MRFFGNARHPPRPERLDAGLFDGFEYAARLRISRHQLAVNFRIVAGELQRDRIGVAAHDRGIAPGHLARRLRQPRLARRKARPLGGKRHLKFRLFRYRAQAARHRALERLGRRFLRSGTELLVRRRHRKSLQRLGKPVTRHTAGIAVDCTECLIAAGAIETRRLDAHGVEIGSHRAKPSGLFLDLLDQ